MKNILKRAIALVTTFCCVASLLVFSGCSTPKKQPVMSINGVEISNDVFTYFLDCATVELGVDAPIESLKKKASTLAGTYFKINSLANKHGVTLTTGEKKAVSEKVDAHWHFFGEYYTEIGISRETLTKVFTADAYRDALLMFFYGTGGEEEIPVARLFGEFKTNYIVFQAITGYFTKTDINGRPVKIPETEAEALILKFQNIAAMVNAGEQTMEEAADFLAETGYKSSVQTVILNKDDTSYPAGFFEKVKKIDAKKATVIGTDEYIFLVLRGDAGVNSEYFIEKKAEMIKIIVGDDIDNKIADSMVVDVVISDSDVNGYYALIKDAKTEK